MVDNALNHPVSMGILVKGPGGIGKSHSLVNLVHKLGHDSNNKYLVTFIPNCANWNSVYDLMESICASIGISSDAITTRFQGFVAESQSFELKKIIAAIDAILGDMEKKFLEYFHTPGMTGPELALLFDELENSHIDAVLELTSGVPLFSTFFVKYDLDRHKYESEVIESVRHSLSKLENETNARDWQRIVPSAISALLQIETAEILYDKKFLLPHQMRNRFLYKPLAPQILTGYRTHLWPDLMSYVEENETTFLNVCRDPDTTKRVGCCFETMVIRRCSRHDVEFQVCGELVKIPSATRTNGFDGDLRPRFLADGMHFPFNPNFKAIDFSLKSGR